MNDSDEDLTLTYIVQVKLYGKPSVEYPRVGKCIAKLLSLSLPRVSVYSDSEDAEFVWSPHDHDGGIYVDRAQQS